MSKSSACKKHILTQARVQCCKSVSHEIHLCDHRCGCSLLTYAEADFLGHYKVTTCHPFQRHLTPIMCCWAHDGSRQGEGNVSMGWRDGWTRSQKASPLKHIAHKDSFSHAGSLRHKLLEAGMLLLASVTIWLSCCWALPLTSISGHCHRQDTNLFSAEQSLESILRLTHPSSLTSVVRTSVAAEDINRHRHRARIKGKENRST